MARTGIRKNRELVLIVYTKPEDKVRALRTARIMHAQQKNKTVRTCYEPPQSDPMKNGCPCVLCVSQRTREYEQAAVVLRNALRKAAYRSGSCISLKFAEEQIQFLTLPPEERARRQAPAEARLKIKDQARRKVLQAIRSGHLVRPLTCDLCGRHRDNPALIRVKGRHQQVIQADHFDYTQPLKVQWLCIPCHNTVTNAGTIAWHLRQMAKYLDHPPPPSWWCWVCHTYHRLCPRMCPVPYGAYARRRLQNHAGHS